MKQFTTLILSLCLIQVVISVINAADDKKTVPHVIYSFYNHWDERSDFGDAFVNFENNVPGNQFKMQNALRHENVDTQYVSEIIQKYGLNSFKDSDNRQQVEKIIAREHPYALWVTMEVHQNTKWLSLTDESLEQAINIGWMIPFQKINNNIVSIVHYYILKISYLEKTMSEANKKVNIYNQNKCIHMIDYFCKSGLNPYFMQKYLCDINRPLSMLV